jgi:glc operon protein GlcG
MRQSFVLLLLALAAGLAAAPGATGQVAQVPHVVNRPALTLEGARRAMAAAEAEAERNNWTVAIAIVDASGELIMFARRDGTQLASVEVAIGKARTAVRFRRPTRALDETLSGGRLALLAIEGLMPIEGGVPITVDGEIVGAIGVSGVTAQQDAAVAEAGVSAIAR